MFLHLGLASSYCPTLITHESYLDGENAFNILQMLFEMYAKIFGKYTNIQTFLFVILTAELQSLSLVLLHWSLLGLFLVSSVSLHWSLLVLFLVSTITKKNRLINIINKIKNAAESCTPNFGWGWLKKWSLILCGLYLESNRVYGFLFEYTYSWTYRLLSLFWFCCRLQKRRIKMC